MNINKAKQDLFNKKVEMIDSICMSLTEYSKTDLSISDNIDSMLSAYTILRVIEYIDFDDNKYTFNLKKIINAIKPDKNYNIIEWLSENNNYLRVVEDIALNLNRKEINYIEEKINDLLDSINNCSYHHSYCFELLHDTDLLFNRNDIDDIIYMFTHEINDIINYIGHISDFFSQYVQDQYIYEAGHSACCVSVLEEFYSLFFKGVISCSDKLSKEVFYSLHDDNIYYIDCKYFGYSGNYIFINNNY